MSNLWPSYAEANLKWLITMLQGFRRNRFMWAGAETLDSPRPLPYTECKLLRPELEDMLKQVNEEIERHEAGLVR